MLPPSRTAGRANERETPDGRVGDREDMDKMLELLSIIEAPDFVLYTWPDQSNQAEEGLKTWPVYHDMVGGFIRLVYDTTALH